MWIVDSSNRYTIKVISVWIDLVDKDKSNVN